MMQHLREFGQGCVHPLQCAGSDDDEVSMLVPPPVSCFNLLGVVPTSSLSARADESCHLVERFRVPVER